MNIKRKFQRAGRGLAVVFWREISFKIEIAAAALVLAAGAYLPLSKVEFLLLVLTCGGVLILEGLNTVCEQMLDLIEPRWHEAVGRLKDALAALVMLSVLAAVAVGLAIFWPYRAILF